MGIAIGLTLSDDAPSTVLLAPGVAGRGREEGLGLTVACILASEEAVG